MNSRQRVIMSFAILVGIIVALYLFTDWFSKATGYALGEDQKIAFATCLRDKRSVLYLTTDCPACDEQRVLLGENAYAIIEKFTCDKERLCNGLTSVPAWELDGTIVYGVKNYRELDALSSCTVEER